MTRHDQSAQDAKPLLLCAYVPIAGVGWSMSQKLKELGISTVRQLRGHSKEMLQRQLGPKTGQVRDKGEQQWCRAAQEACIKGFVVEAPCMQPLRLSGRLFVFGLALLS